MKSRLIIKTMFLSTLLLTLILSSQATAPAQAQAFSCSNVTEIPQAECQSFE